MPLRPFKTPYYLSRPNGPAERAPGWYMQRTEDVAPIYIGANHVDAEITIKEMVNSRKVKAAG
ncbi:MAG: hypothetical protein ACJ75S_08565 [Solirubrobacterales bacterium]